MPRLVRLPESIDYALIIAVARAVSQRREWAPTLTPQQAFELAYDAINSHVMRGETLGDNPSKFLAFIGIRSVRTVLKNRVDEAAPENMRPHFAKYWTGERGYASDHAADVDERISVRQAIEGLSPQEQGDLIALAESFDGATAAQKRGVGRVHFVKRCRQAREAFFRLWYEGETVPALPKRVVNRVA